MRRPSPVSSPGTCGCLSLWLPPSPTNLLRRVAAVSIGPARGRAAAANVNPIITIVLLGNVAKVVDTLRQQAQLLKPYVVLAENITDRELGALTPGAVATPRQFRPPAWLTRWGGVWTSWTANPRRGALHGDCKYLADARTKLLARVGV